MKRPYVICHILSSLDGKIVGPFMKTSITRQLGKEYGRIRAELNADAWMYGTTTTREFTSFIDPVVEKKDRVPEGDFIVPAKEKLYYVSVDAGGEIGWESGTFQMAGRPDAHVIELVTETTDPAYKAYLRKKGVSYIVAGKEKLDCREAMEKLYKNFLVEKLLICGGGVTNWEFLQAGVVDELSLLLSPVTDGSVGKASVFTCISSIMESSPVEFELKNIKKLAGSGLHLSYLVKKCNM